MIEDVCSNTEMRWREEREMQDYKSKLQERIRGAEATRTMGGIHWP
jgi:hypothetical protein